jgi:hypothetical protein
MGKREREFVKVFVEVSDNGKKMGTRWWNIWNNIEKIKRRWVNETRTIFTKEL